MNKSKFASIPTKYKGIQFRSRLEARWAVLFDLLKWKWEYEPFDLNGWIPDFIIKGNKDILVEIKPFGVYAPYPDIDERWTTQIEKITKADPDLPVLLLANTPLENEANQIGGVFGFIFQKFNNQWLTEDIYEMVLAWGSTPFLVENMPSTHAPDFCVKGTVDIMIKDFLSEHLTDYWNYAGNETQWKKPAKNL